MLLPIIHTEPYFSKPTVQLAEAYNAQAEAHNVKAAAHESRAAETVKGDLAEVDVGEIFAAKGLAAERFKLRQCALRIRRESLTPLLAARAADRRRHAEELDAKIEPARAVIVKKMIAMGFCGDGVHFDHQQPGCIVPAQVNAHPTVGAARNAAQDAIALCSSIHDQTLNVEAIAELEAALRHATHAATA